jgi:hypothetical protein
VLFCPDQAAAVVVVWLMLQPLLLLPLLPSVLLLCACVAAALYQRLAGMQGQREVLTLQMHKQGSVHVVG